MGSDSGVLGGRIGFARWRSSVVSGGNRYDDALAAGLGALGVDCHERVITGSWPLPANGDKLRLARALTAEHDWLVDNILGSAAPEVITEAIRAGRRVALLVHYFPADDPALSSSQRRILGGLEARAIEAASTVVVTSRWAADEVFARYGRRDAIVAVPGVEAAARAPGSVGATQPPRLLWLGSLTQTKDPLTFVDALTRVQDLDWTARLVGPDSIDARLTHTVRERLTLSGLAHRVRVCGPREGEDLEAVWEGTNLLVHTSRAETYGMVVAEALARGIPSIVPAGTGAAEAQRAGCTYPCGDADHLARSLRAWMTDSRLRELWRVNARRSRASLPTWIDTAHAVMAAFV